MARKPIDNERKACDAVVRSLEALAQKRRSNTHSPEDEGSDAPIEYAFDLGDQTYAIEHTVVEAFEGQINSDIDFDRFVSPITSALDGKLPAPGLFNVAFAIHPTKGMKPKAITETQAEIVEWIRTSAAELHAEFPTAESKKQNIRGRQNRKRAAICGLDLVLSREVGWFVTEKFEGHLMPSRFAPKNYEDLRLERIKTAMGRKLPKLRKWQDEGARTVLVLENRDMALSNHVAILEAAEKALIGRSDVPDEVWFVDTTIETEWTAMCVMRDCISFPDDEAPTRYYDYDPSSLDK